MERSHSRNTYKFDKFIPISLRRNGIDGVAMKTIKKLQIRKERQHSRKEAVSYLAHNEWDD